MSGSWTSMNFFARTQNLLRSFRNRRSPDSQATADKLLLTLGRALANEVKLKSRIQSFREIEFSIYSQFGDDGIIQWLISRLSLPHDTFVEFGVENYTEANTRFLLMNDNWSGLIMDGSPDNISQVVNAPYFWRYDLQARAAFVTPENVNSLIGSAGFEPDVGLLHIDVDGNDYWIWNAVNTIRPIVVIVEY